MQNIQRQVRVCICDPEDVSSWLYIFTVKNKRWNGFSVSFKKFSKRDSPPRSQWWVWKVELTGTWSGLCGNGSRDASPFPPCRMNGICTQSKQTSPWRTKQETTGKLIELTNFRVDKRQLQCPVTFRWSLSVKNRWALNYKSESHRGEVPTHLSRKPRRFLILGCLSWTWAAACLTGVPFFSSWADEAEHTGKRLQGESQVEKLMRIYHHWGLQQIVDNQQLQLAIISCWRLVVFTGTLHNELWLRQVEKYDNDKYFAVIILIQIFK